MQTYVMPESIAKPRDPKFLREEGSTFVDCTHCNGTAKDPAFVKTARPCPKCDGRGWFVQRDPAKVAAEKAIHDARVDAFYAEKAAEKAAYEADAATRKAFRQVTLTTNDSNGEDMDINLDLWLDEAGQIQVEWTPYFPTRE